MDLELRHLKYFVAVAEELSFTRAARRLHIAQPPLSVQIRKLELEIGAPLFSREGRGIKLTEAGRVFLEQARNTLMHASRSLTLARQAADGEIGNLSIGYNNPAGFRVFPKIVPAFKKCWPRIHLTFHDMRIPQQIDKLRRDELDIGFVWLPVPTDEFEVEELLQEPLIAAIPATHRLVTAQNISMKDLSSEPLVILSRSLDAETFHQIKEMFARGQAVMNVIYELETLLSIINFVAMGSGCSILPDYARAIRPDGVVYKPLQRNTTKTLAIIKKKESGVIAESFYRFTVDTLSRGPQSRALSRRRR